MDIFVAYTENKPEFNINNATYVCNNDIDNSNYINIYDGTLFIPEIVGLTFSYIDIFKMIVNDNIDKALILSQYCIIDNTENFIYDVNDIQLSDNDDIIMLNDNQLMFAFIITNQACVKILESIKKNIKNLDEYANELNLNIVNVQVNGYSNTFPHINIVEGYKFYSGYDSHGYDVGYFDNSLDELINITNESLTNTGFNSLGYVKNNTQPCNKFIKLQNASINDGYYEKIYDDHINNIINNLCIKKNNESGITFTITTCKRLNLFIKTMDTLLLKCTDIDLIDRWICIDDNSDEYDRKIMVEKYPFFEYVFKNENEKGHAKSMNMIWDMVDTEYILHFEDDWFCNNFFTLNNLMTFVKDNNMNHLCLKKIGNGNNSHDNFFYKYEYNESHYLKPELNKYYDIIFTNCKDAKNSNTKDGWWWPGFTLNPSIINVKYMKNNIGKFSDTMRQELFEYDYAMRCHHRNVEIYYVTNDINHIGNVSSYLLNNMNRYYDK